MAAPLLNRPNALVVVALICASSCADLDVVTASYATLEEARDAGAIARGWLPEGLPAGTVDIREAHDLDSNAQWGLFNFPVAEIRQLLALLDPAGHSLEGQTCEPPRRIEWWPVLLRGTLDAERIAATGLKTYRSRDGRLIFAVNWKQGRAYYWSIVQ